MAKRRTKKPAPRRRRSLLGRLIRLLPSLCVGFLVVWVGLFVVLAPELPDTDALFVDAKQARVTVLAYDGALITERGVEGRTYVGLDEISPHVISAVLATEDRRFYDHFGLDVIGIGRAVLRNLSAGTYVAGGSTITQQLAKNLYLTPERSLKRKVQELILAIWLEARLSKDEILELYLNRVYLGAGAYGVEAAARRYFAKPSNALNVAQSAMIAGLLKAPTRYAPTNDLDLARARAAVVLGLMVDAGYLSPEDAKKVGASPVTLASGAGDRIGAHFVDYVLDDLTNHLGKPQRDWVVKTTLDLRLQRQLEETVQTMLRPHQGIQAAVVLLDRSGAVRAMVGGRSYGSKSFNRAVSAKRQPGSAFKPFIYLAAIERGWRPGSTIDDVPFSIDGWQPGNGGGKFYGEVTLETAFAKSINTVAVRLSEAVGRDAVIDTAHQLGIGSDLRNVASLALGTSEVTPLELTGAYLPFATEGIRRPTYSVERVTDADAGTLYRYLPSEVTVFDQNTGLAMQQLLAAVVRDGTGKRAALPDRRAFGKTGTTQNNRDAWFVGFAGDYIGGVWLGRDDGAAMPGINGSTLPAEIWRDVMLQTPAPAAVVASSDRPEPNDSGAAGSDQFVLRNFFKWLSGSIE